MKSVMEQKNMICHKITQRLELQAPDTLNDITPVSSKLKSPIYYTFLI
jgi:hypothetical protein